MFLSSKLLVLSLTLTSVILVSGEEERQENRNQCEFFYDDDAHYFGGFVQSQPSTLNNVDSFDDCWDECEARTDCNFVTYHGAAKQCFLKARDTGRIDRQGYQSGGCRIKSTFIVSCNDTISDSEDPNAVLPLNNGPGNMCYDIDCPYYVEENYKYTSPNLPDGFYELGDVATEEECAEKCKERSFECKFFTFVRAGEVDSGCHLKACDGGREAASINYRSGGYQCLRENQACRPKWTQVGDVCVHIARYRWTYDFSKTFCTQTGGRVYEPRDSATEASIRSWLATWPPFQGNKAPWIGINDSASEGNFVYESDGQPITFSSWKPGQPDNTGSDPNGQDCVYYHPNNGNPLWNDIKCTVKINPVCEMAPSTI